MDEEIWEEFLVAEVNGELVEVDDPCEYCELDYCIECAESCSAWREFRDAKPLSDC